MRKLCEIRGYAAVFNQTSLELYDDDGEPFIEVIKADAFRFLIHAIRADVLHCPNILCGSTVDRSLQVWQDPSGLAFALDVEATQGGRALRDMVSDGGVSQMSVGLIIKDSTITQDETGRRVREINNADVDHISFVDRGIYEETSCWVAGTAPDRLSPKLRAASRHWCLGKITHEKKQTEDRKLVAKFLADPGASERFFSRAV
jgi:HK97 family phage prohead protease